MLVFQSVFRVIAFRYSYALLIIWLICHLDSLTHCIALHHSVSYHVICLMLCYVKALLKFAVIYTGESRSSIFTLGQVTIRVFTVVTIKGFDKFQINEGKRADTFPRKLNITIFGRTLN